MTALNKDALKALFQTGDTITQTTMANLIDSFIDTVETSVQNITGPINFNGDISINGGIAVSAITSGQLLIGMGSNGTLKKATLTAGTNIGIVNSDGGITITASTGGASGVLLQTINASAAATIDFTSLTSTYKSYVIEASNILAATDAVSMQMLVSLSGVFQTDSTYQWYLTSNATATNSNADNSITLCAANISNVDNSSDLQRAGFYIQIDSFTNNANSTFNCFSRGSATDSGGGYHNYVSSGTRVITGPYDGIRLLLSSGNITKGIFRLFGIL